MRIRSELELLYRRGRGMQDSAVASEKSRIRVLGHSALVVGALLALSTFRSSTNRCRLKSTPANSRGPPARRLGASPDRCTHDDAVIRRAKVGGSRHVAEIG